MKVSRRDVMCWLGVTAAGGALLPATRALGQALAGQESPSPLFWLKGAEDSNLLAQLGREVPEFWNLVAEDWDLADYEPLLPTGYPPPAADPAQAPIVVLEALPPAAEAGAPEKSRAYGLLRPAKAAILLGSDACYGGPGAGADDVAAVEAFCKREKTPLIKLPGIPVPPQHLVGTLAQLEFFGFPPLDRFRRPVLYYGETVCRDCERRGDLETGRFADRPGAAGCLWQLGCKGPVTHNSCARTRWNGGENWCVGAGGPCVGCSEPGYPDHAGLGLYGRVDLGGATEASPALRHIDQVGLGLLALVAAGLGVRLTRRLLAGRSEPEPPPASPPDV